MSTKLMVGNLTHQSVHKVRRRLFEEKDEGSRHAKPAQSSNEQCGSKAANEVNITMVNVLFFENFTIRISNEYQ